MRWHNYKKKLVFLVDDLLPALKLIILRERLEENLLKELIVHLLDQPIILL